MKMRSPTLISQLSISNMNFMNLTTFSYGSIVLLWHALLASFSSMQDGGGGQVKAEATQSHNNQNKSYVFNCLYLLLKCHSPNKVEEYAASFLFPHYKIPGILKLLL